MNDLIQQARAAFDRDFTTTALKVLIVAWAFFIAVLALTIDNKWLLAGLLAYEVLP